MSGCRLRKQGSWISLSCTNFNTYVTVIHSQPASSCHVTHRQIGALGTELYDSWWLACPSQLHHLLLQDMLLLHPQCLAGGVFSSGHGGVFGQQLQTDKGAS